ncbi:MAG: hydroxymethylbilane synthase [Actinobacteria bacterium]|nr:hydroxymethylbilane synthase [Actinomycetota bacterium]
MRIATRGSRLARWQAETVATQLKALGHEPELVLVKTEGDRDQQSPIWELSGRGVFVKEVQAAVLDGRADLAVHSAKDLMSIPTVGLKIIGGLKRGNVCDSLIGTRLHELREGAVVATGSVRRKAQLSNIRPDLNFVGLRGNIETRIGALQSKEIDAIVAAAAALERLGIVNVISETLDETIFVPQVGQGAIALECRTSDETIGEILTNLIDLNTSECVQAERSFLAELGGGCDLPVGAYATKTGEVMTLTAVIATHDGSTIIRDEKTGTHPTPLGKDIADSLLNDKGGASLLHSRERPEM